VSVRLGRSFTATSIDNNSDIFHHKIFPTVGKGVASLWGTKKQKN